MHSENWKIALACFIGGTIGAFSALQFGNHFWWIGLLVGFTLGYITYRPREVLEATRKAYLYSRDEMFPTLKSDLPHLLTENRAIAVATGKELARPRPFFFLFLTGASTLMYLMMRARSGILLWILAFVCSTLCSAIATVMLGGFSGLLITAGVCIAEGHTRRKMDWYYRRNYAPEPSDLFAMVITLSEMKEILKDTFLNLTLIIFKLIPLFLFKIVWYTFRLVHSERRLLCGFDAALGCAVGYFLHHALLGGLAGVVFGLVSYEIVARRLLEPKGLLIRPE